MSQFVVFTVELKGQRKYEGYSKGEAMTYFERLRYQKEKSDLLRLLANGRPTIVMGPQE